LFYFIYFIFSILFLFFFSISFFTWSGTDECTHLSGGTTPSDALFHRKKRVSYIFLCSGTIDAAYHTAERIQHDAETVGTVGGYVAHKVADKASTVYESVADSAKIATNTELGIDSFLSSPTGTL
jgi:hypothetical protein